MRCCPMGPGKLHGRAKVAGTRMFADSILENYDDGMTPEEISYTYSTDLPYVVAIIKFVNLKRLRATA